MQYSLVRGVEARLREQRSDMAKRLLAARTQHGEGSWREDGACNEPPLPDTRSPPPLVPRLVSHT